MWQSLKSYITKGQNVDHFVPNALRAVENSKKSVLKGMCATMSVE